MFLVKFNVFQKFPFFKNFVSSNLVKIMFETSST